MIYREPSGRMTPAETHSRPTDGIVGTDPRGIAAAARSAWVALLPGLLLLIGP